MAESTLSKIKDGIKKEETKLEGEIKKEEKAITWFFKSHTFKILILIIVFGILIGLVVYLANSQGKIYVEKSEVSAPLITLSAPSPGIIDKIFVREGDTVPAETIVAQVAGNPIKTKVSGSIIFVQNTPGQSASQATPIVQMIDPNELRIIGHIEEDKGLSEIKPGQRVLFTVDAFGNKKYEGVVESISPASRQSDIVFSISDKRQEKEFDIKVKYPIYSYSELRQGMSAKMWIYK